MTLSRYRYVVVEGPIGAGKTSLTYKLAERLDADARVEELARMLGGIKITATTRQHAAEMLAG